MTDSNQSGRTRLLIVAAACAIGLVAVAAAALSLRTTETAVDAMVLQVVVSSERLDFGDVPLRKAVKRQLLLRNDSDEPITARVHIDGHSGYLVEPQELILHPGISSRVLVAVRPDQPGPLNDTLRIDFGGRNAVPIVVSLDGNAGDATRPAVAPEDARRRVSNDSADDPDAPARTGATADGATRRVATGTPSRVTASQPADRVAQIGAPQIASSGTTGPPTGANRGPIAQPTTPETGNSARRSVNPAASSRQNTPFTPGVPANVPFVGIADAAPSGGVEATPAVRELSSRIPGVEDGGLPADLPDDLMPDGDDDLFDDVWDDDADDPNIEPEGDEPSKDPPSEGPLMRISGLSTVRVMGSVSSFYPQAIPVAGGSFGGGIGLGDIVRFPQTGLAFGEAVIISQVGGAAGSFDPGSGQLDLQVPVHILDTDGDAAPVTMKLTTGTTVNQNESGVLVSMSGTPRDPSSGLVRLVAVEKVPVGYKNGAEDQLVIVELLATLTFDDQPSSGFGGF